MVKQFFLLLFVVSSLGAFGQGTAVLPHCENDAFHREVLKYTSNDVEQIDVDKLRSESDWVILDAREKIEYETSHLPKARYVGYDDFDWERVESLDRGAKIAVYCSIGYRSEKIAKRLEKKGFTNVHNVYGSIFEWANRGYPLIKTSGEPTNQVHTYNRKWSKWVNSPDVEKVW